MAVKLGEGSPAERPGAERPAERPGPDRPPPGEYGSTRPEVPFGGVGQSGLGREPGALGLQAWTEPEPVFVAR